MAVEEQDESAAKEAEKELSEIEKLTKDLELENLFNGEFDESNAILAVHPGAGGTESQDWAEMLLRMYTRWAERKGFKSQILDFQYGDEAGVKSAVISIKGKHAFGLLEGEKGVHRLVRISPFDSAKRRHTSFASVDVIPEIEEETEVEVDSKDLRIETYRASGPGGQHVNKTDSAVRITHIPTGTVAQCQSGRSQTSNKETAMKLLKARIFELERQKKEKELKEIRGEQKEIAWGSQIRSYVFHPYSMVKDHRTETQTGNVQAVMDGEIDEFVDSYLRSGSK
jgi:peptide chain release factor 2